MGLTLVTINRHLRAFGLEPVTEYPPKRHKRPVPRPNDPGYAEWRYNQFMRPEGHRIVARARYPEERSEYGGIL
jgi:hypothetical protein